MNRCAIALFIAAGAVLSGCGLGMLQTAKTTPAGELDFSLAAGYMHNEMIEVRNVGLGNLPVNFGVRYGAITWTSVRPFSWAWASCRTSSTTSSPPNARWH